MSYSFKKSNYPHKQLSKLTAAEKTQAQLSTDMKKAVLEERKAAYHATSILKGLEERGRMQIANSVKPTRHRRASASTKRNNTTRSKRHKSADDIAENQVANDITRWHRMRVKENKNKVDLLDRINKMPLVLQEEIYSWIDDPKTQHLTRPVISKRIVRNRTEKKHLFQLLEDHKLDGLVYDQVDGVFNDESMFSHIYNTSRFRSAEDADDVPYIRENTKKRKVFARSLEEFIEKTKIEYSITGDYIRFRILPKNSTSEDKLDYDGFITIDTYLDDIGPDPNGGPWYDHMPAGQPDLYSEFDDETRAFMRKHFVDLDKRVMVIDLVRFKILPSKFFVAYLPRF